MANKVIHCQFCGKLLKDEAAYAEHIDRKHHEQILPGMIPRQFVYYLRTGKEKGSCVVCKSDTSWNEVTNKYNRLCGKQECKDALREKFKENMMGKYGKTSLLGVEFINGVIVSKSTDSSFYLHMNWNSWYF